MSRLGNAFQQLRNLISGVSETELQLQASEEVEQRKQAACNRSEIDVLRQEERLRLRESEHACVKQKLDDLILNATARGQSPVRSVEAMDLINKLRMIKAQESTHRTHLQLLRRHLHQLRQSHQTVVLHNTLLRNSLETGTENEDDAAILQNMQASLRDSINSLQDREQDNKEIDSDLAGIDDSQDSLDTRSALELYIRNLQQTQTTSTATPALMNDATQQLVVTQNSTRLQQPVQSRMEMLGMM